MATPNSFLANWVKSAYSMEMGLVPMLEEQTRQVQDDPELRRGLDTHLQKTRRHVEMLRDCLQRMGENTAALRPSNPIISAYGSPNGSGPAIERQTELLDYVTESFEVASYRALISLAETAGDHETSRVCRQILEDELAITEALDRRLPEQVRGSAGDGQGSSTATDTVRFARESFDALNAHDLDRSEQRFAPDFRGEAPGAPGPLDRSQNRAYVEEYIRAFPDLHFDLEGTIASGDDVVMQWLGTGTHTGPMRSPDGMEIPPTNRQCRVHGSTTYYFSNGKIASQRVLFDTGELLRQLGLLPSGTSRSIVHLEIPAADREVAARFYSEMFGWEYEHMPAEMKYTTFRTGNIGGGFPDTGEMYQPGDVIFYLASDDIETDLRQAEKLGARTVTPKTEIPGMGYYAILTDPTGNPVGLFAQR